MSISAYEITTLFQVVGSIASAAGTFGAMKASPRLKAFAEKKSELKRDLWEDFEAKIIKLPEVGNLTQYE